VVPRASSGPAAPVRLRIESLAYGGEGVARHQGKVCFVAGAFPGEEVEAVPASRRRNFDRWRLQRVVEPSPERRLPLCPHLDLCGGCSTQALRYESQLAAKGAQVRDCLERIGRLRVSEPHPPLPSPVLVGYRNKMEYTFAARPWLPTAPPEGGEAAPALGLHVPGRFDAVFDLQACALPSGATVRLLPLVRAFVRRHGLTVWRDEHRRGLLRHLVVREGKNTGEILLGLVVSEPHPALRLLASELAAAEPRLEGMVQIVNDRPASIARGEREEVLIGRPYLRERLGSLLFEVQAQSFFQTNTWGAEVLISAARRLLGARAGGHLLDLYCGAGTLGLSLADRFDRLTGVEQAESAVADARRNAALNRVDRCQFLAAPVEEWMRAAADARPDYAGIVVDPPRAGLHPRALRGLIELGPPWILYVSCNPSTLARDAAGLVEAGYGPRALQVVDLFPHTAHVESVLLLER